MASEPGEHGERSGHAERARLANAPDERGGEREHVMTRHVPIPVFPAAYRRLPQLTWSLTPHSRTGGFASGTAAPSLEPLSPARPDASRLTGGAAYL